jgi:hypothetical protein
MADLIPECGGVLHLADKMRRTQVPEIVAVAEEMVRNHYDYAIEERERWIDARGKVDRLIEALGSSPQFAELRDRMDDAAACWDDCAREYSNFLESAALPCESAPSPRQA